jgi:thioredoxin reductase (NADPH)
MEQALRPYCAELGLTLRVVEIDGDADLRARYADKIPVLMAGDTEICHYYLDPEALRAHFGHSADSV